MFKMTNSKRFFSILVSLAMMMGLMLTSVPTFAADTLLYETNFSDYTGGIPAGWGGQNATFTAVSDESYGTTLEMSSIKQYGNISRKIALSDKATKGLKIDMAIKLHSLGRDALQIFDINGSSVDYYFAFYSGGYIGYKGGNVFDGGSLRYEDDIWYELSLTFVPSQNGLVFGTLTDENGKTQKFAAATGTQDFSGECYLGMMESGSNPDLTVSFGYLRYSETSDIKAPGMDEQCDFEDAVSPTSVAGFGTSQASYMSIANSGTDHGKVLQCDGMPTGTMTQFIKNGAFSSGTVAAECSVKAGKNMRFEMFAEGTGTDDVSPNKYSGYFFPMSFGLVPGEMWIGCKPYDCAEADVDLYKLSYAWGNDGWYRVRVIFDLDQHVMTLRIASESDPTNEIVKSKSLAFTSLSNIVFAAESGPNADAEGTTPLYIDDIRIYEPSAVKLIASGVANGATGVKVNKPITFKFNMPIAEVVATLNNEAAAVKKNVYENEISIAPASGKFMLDTNYTLRLTGIKDPFGNTVDDITLSFKTLDRFMTTAATFKNAAGETTNAVTAGKMTASASFTFTDDEARDIVLIAALYDKTTNKCCEVKAKSLTGVLSGAEDFELTVPAENPKNYKIVVYYWEGYQTLAPYTGSLSLGK